MNAKIKKRLSMAALFKKNPHCGYVAASDKKTDAPACVAGGVCGR
ncbi:hypothetical protein [Rhodanobacter panaciterrae]|nr:hypothetical protein [Rhodanobacter panaciterrae]